MSYSGTTPNLGLPIYSKGNRPTYMSDWNKTMNILDSSQGSLVTDVNGLKTDVAQNTGSIQVVQSSITTIQTDLACAQEKIRQHTTEINNLTGRVAALEQGGASEEEITQIKAQIATLQSNISQLTSEMSDVMADVSVAEGEITKINNSIFKYVPNSKLPVTGVDTDATIGPFLNTVYSDINKVMLMLTNFYYGNTPGTARKLVKFNFFTVKDIATYRTMQGRVLGMSFLNYTLTMSIPQNDDYLSADNNPQFYLNNPSTASANTTYPAFIMLAGDMLNCMTYNFN